jgi:hypothetical protein
MASDRTNKDDEWVLAQLNQKIETLGELASRLQEERGAAAKSFARARRHFAYLQLVRRLRLPAESFELWPVALLTVGPILIGALLLVLASVFTSAVSAGLLAFAFGVVAGAGVLAYALFRPSGGELPAAIKLTAADRHDAEARLEDVSARLTAAKDEHRKLFEERRELMASGQVQRAALLQRDWKAMREAEWEDFVVEVCRTLGYRVERLSASDGDVNFLVETDGRRVAVATRAAGQVVNSGAVQQALAGKAPYKADGCAIVLNRRFTGAAQDFAKRQGCTLVGVEEFPDFALGKIPL